MGVLSRLGVIPIFWGVAERKIVEASSLYVYVIKIYNKSTYRYSYKVHKLIYHWSGILMQVVHGLEKLQ